MSTGNVTMISAESDQNLNTLRELREILQTTVGPTGSSKLLVTGGGYCELTSTSSALLERLELENPICRYIGHVARHLPEHGLYFGVLVSHLVEKSWTCGRLPTKTFSYISSTLMETLKSLLNSELITRKVDFSTINDFLPLIKTIITSKCRTLRPDVDVNRLCIEIIRVFLNCIDEQKNIIGRVYVKCKQGQTSFSSHNGLLYEIVEDHDIAMVKTTIGEVKLLVFTMKLEEQVEEGSHLANQVMPILEAAVKLNVKLIVCQKTVAPSFKLYLTRHNIILLERAGSDLTAILLEISQAFPISYLPEHLPDVETLSGRLSSVRHIQFNNSDYILLQCEHESVGTLLIENYSLAGTEYLKSLAQQAFSSLGAFAAHPVLSFGGGCLEAWLVAQIQLLKGTEGTREMVSVYCWVQQALLSACGPAAPTVLDSTYHHGWADGAGSCRCGLVTRAMLQQAGGSSLFLSELLGPRSEPRLLPPARPAGPLHAGLLVHAHLQKLNVILSSLETFVNLTDVGLIVYNHSDS